MQMRKWLIVGFCLALPFAVTAGEPGKVREINVKGVKFEFKRGSVKTPRILTSAEDLDKAIANSDGIKKQVDFAKDQLVLFTWAGSGGDKLMPVVDAKTVTFRYTPGLTRDLRQHAHLFAVPKGAEVKVVGGR